MSQVKTHYKMDSRLRGNDVGVIHNVIPAKAGIHLSNNTTLSFLKLIFCLLLVFFIHPTYASNLTMRQTQNQLKQIETQMSQLQRHINHTHDQQHLINQELAKTEKKIHEAQEKIKKNQHEVMNKQQQIVALAQQNRLLNDQLQQQQRLLAKHLLINYKTKNNSHFSALTPQEQRDAQTRLLVFNQYLIRARQKMITNMNTIKTALLRNQNKLDRDLATQKNLQQTLHKQQQHFDQDKQYRTQLIQSLNHDIQTQQNTLLACQRNKANLSKLLHELTRRSAILTQRPFTSMKKRYPMPVITNKNRIRKINQGIVFPANEGTPVSAIFPGKIVFADWLNGYGLLMIIDHGRGFMTLYANNRSLLKHKGDIVKQGDKIAFVGHSGTLKENGLYFEIRQRGKAVNPLEWMS